MLVIIGACSLGGREVKAVSKAVRELFEAEAGEWRVWPIRKEMKRPQPLCQGTKHKWIAFETAVLFLEVVCKLDVEDGNDAGYGVDALGVDCIWVVLF